MINLLPNKILNLIGKWLDNKDLKVATMVCKLLWDIFLPIYLKRNEFSPHQSFISLKGLSSYWVFKSYHCFLHPPQQAYLSTFFGMDANTDTELLCLAYALVQFPARAFGSISLCFSHYTVIHAQLLNKLLVALAPIQCENLAIHACLTANQYIDGIMPPAYTPIIWNLTSLTIEGNLNYTPFRQLLFGASALLEELTLHSFQATSTTSLWKMLLNTTTFPNLQFFQTSKDIPLPLLLDFLFWHPKVSSLTITVNKDSKTMLTNYVMKKFDLKSLIIISGPPSYIFTILCSVSIPLSLAWLLLLLNHLPNMLIFPKVLKCLAPCQKVEAFEVTIIPCQNCRVSTQTSNIFSLLDFTTLTIKVFRIRLLNSDFLEDGIASNDDGNVTNEYIMVSFTISNTAQFILTCLCTFRLHGMNGGITSVLLNTFNWRNPSLTLVNLFLRNHVSDSQHLLHLFLWAFMWWKINLHLKTVVSICILRLIFYNWGLIHIYIYTKK